MPVVDVTPDPRPEQRIVADQQEWGRIYMLKYGPCRVTGEFEQGRTIDLAHLVSRAQRGDDVPDNIIPLRHDLHMILHDHSPGWEEIAHAVRHSLTPAETAYIVAKKSRWWLNKMYPKGDEKLCASCRKRLESDEEKAERKSQPPRPRKRWVVTVPDDAEDGADVLDTLVEAHRQRLASVLGWDNDVGAYYVVVSALSEALQ